MKKWLFGFLGFIFFLVLIVPLFLPSHFSVERSITINKSRKDVYSKIINLETWPEWSPWFAMEPEADYQVQGIPGIVGAVASWKGKKIGAGKQTLTQLVEPEFVLFNLEFTEPQQSKAQSSFTITEEGESSHILWKMDGALSYPLERYFGLLMDGMIGKDFEKGLLSLKANLEQ